MQLEIAITKMKKYAHEVVAFLFEKYQVCQMSTWITKMFLFYNSNAYNEN